MGGCLRVQNPHIPQKSLLTECTERLQEEMLLFDVRVHGLKLRGVELSNPVIAMEFGSVRSEIYSGELQKDKATIVWPVDWSFNYHASLQHLKRDFFTIEIFKPKHSNKLKLFQRIQLQLNTVVQTPVYHSFAIKRKKKQIGRLLFNIEMKQTTRMKVYPISVACIFDDPRPGEYSFTARIISNCRLESEQSELKEEPVWEGDFRDMTLDYDCNIDNLRRASLQLKIWRKFHTQQKLFGECWVAFPKLLRDAKDYMYYAKGIQATGSTIEDPTVYPLKEASIRSFTEHLWKKGRKIGSISAAFHISNLPFVFQMMTGTATDDGFNVQSPVTVGFCKSKKGKHNLPGCMQRIKELTVRLKTFDHHRQENCNRLGLLSLSEYDSHRAVIEELTELLKKSDKTTMTCFLYKNTLALIRSQNILLNLGEHLLSFADLVVYDFRPYYYACLTELLKRGELDLGNLTWDPHCSHASVCRQVASRYQTFLIEMLQLTLIMINFKGADPRVANFFEEFCVMAYFRIPGFRDRVFRCLKRKSFGNVEEWRGISMNLEGNNDKEELIPVLDWNTRFYQLLSHHEYHSKLDMLLDSQKWQYILAKRSIVYFRFVAKWASHVDRQLVRLEHVPWYYIPGYDIIIKTFLLELKCRNILRYPQVLITASCALLSNAALITSMVKILFKKTNLSNFHIVRETFMILSKWFEVLESSKTELPENFESEFFITGIRRSLSSEICFNLLEAMEFIYSHYSLINGKLRQRIVLKYLLKERNFVRLFYHWNRDVRRMFMFLILYRMLAYEDLKLTDHEENVVINQDIIQRVIQLSEEDTILCKMPRKVYIQLGSRDFYKLKGDYLNWVEETRLTHGGECSIRKLKVPRVRKTIEVIDRSEREYDEDW